MINWIPFFRTLAVASDSAARFVQPLPYAASIQLTDARLNLEAATYNMIPLPGGRGDLGHSELAGLHIREESR